MPPGAWACGSRASLVSPHPGPLPQGEREHALLSFPRNLSPTFVIGERESRDDAGHVHGVSSAIPPSVVSPPSSVSPPFSVILNEVKKLAFRLHGHAVGDVGLRIASEPFFPLTPALSRKGRGSQGTSHSVSIRLGWQW